MKKIRKGSEVLEAVQWNGSGSEKEISEFMGSKTLQLENENYVVKLENGSCVLGSLYIKTLEGEVKAEIGDWIIKGVKGKFYPCKPDDFKKNYEVIENEGVEDFKVMCDVCGSIYINHAGSTPCCGSIAYLVDENGNKTDNFMLFSKVETKSKIN